jgi:hypothetical protein
MRKYTHALLLVLAASLVATPALALIDFTWDVDHHVQFGGDFTYLEYHGIVTNTGDERVTYTIDKSAIIPDDFMWSASICVGDFCYAPFVDYVETDAIDPGLSVDVRIDIVVGMTVTTGYGELIVGTVEAGGPVMTKHFAAIHTSCDCLIVDDYDEAYGVWPSFTTVSDNLTGKIAGHWPRAWEAPDTDDLQTLPMAAWLCGDTGTGLDADDRAAIGPFLDAGGRMLVAGEDIAWNLCDPASPDYSTGSNDWVESFFDITYQLDSGSPDITGLPGSDVGQGLSFSLPGDADPDIIALGRAGGYQFESVGFAATGVLVTDVKRLLFLGFNLAEVPAGELTTLLSGACDALALPSASDTPALPAGLVLHQNAPNPFNPKTTLRFAAPAAGLARIDVMDVTGRRVAALLQEVEAGENQFQFTGDGLASGTYFYRVSLGDESAVGKMTLLK